MLLLIAALGWFNGEDTDATRFLGQQGDDA